MPDRKHRERRIVRCAVVGNNSNGSPDIMYVKVSCTKEMFDNGKHYVAAKAFIEDQYTFDPVIVIDEEDDGKAILQLCEWDSIDEVIQVNE